MYVIPTGLIAWILRKCGEWICIIIGIVLVMGGEPSFGVVWLIIGIVWLIIKRKLKQKEAEAQTSQARQLQQPQQTQQSVQPQPEMTANTNNTPPVQSAAFCTNCGTRVKNDALFCSNCGTKLK